MPISPRLNRIFGQNLEPSPTYPTEGMINPSPPEEDYDVNRRMSELYQPESRSSDFFDRLLQNYPERQSPSKLRRIGAAMMSLGPAGYEGGRKALQQPFYDELEDWRNRIEPAGQAATNERMANINLRTLANQITSQELRDKSIDRQIERDRILREQGAERIGQGEQRIGQSEQRIRQGEQRLKIAQEVAKGGRFTVERGGQAFMVYRDGSKAPVDVDMLGPEELENLRQEHALERIEAGGEVRERTQRDRIRTEVIEDPDNPGKRILVNVNQDTGEVTPARFDRKTVTPSVRAPEAETQQTAGIANRARQVKLSKPEWAKFIKMKGNVFERIVTPGFLGPTKEMYDQIYQAIYGSSSPGSTQGDKIIIVGPEGQLRKFPSGQELPRGWKAQ